MRNLSLAFGLALVLGLQGCGGGGSSDNSTNNSGINKTSNITQNESNSKLATTSSSSSSEDKIVYALVEKLEVFDDYNATTTYKYNGNYVAESNTTTTLGYKFDKRYTYDTANKELKVMVKNPLDQMELTQRVKFEDGVANKHIDLARNENQVYLYTTFDPINYFEHKRVVESVKDIEKELYNTKYYSYQDNNLSNLKVGYKDSLDGTFTLSKEYSYSYDEVGNLSLDHSFEYSDNNKTVTEKAGSNIVRVYKFEVVGG